MKAIVAKTIRARQRSKRLAHLKEVRELLGDIKKMFDEKEAVIEAIKKYYPTRLDDYLEGRLYIKVVEINDGNREAINILKLLGSVDGNIVISYDYGELYV